MSTVTLPDTPRPTIRAKQVPSRHRRGAGRWVVLVAVTIGALVMLVPFAFMLLNAFKSPSDYSTNGALSWPTGFYTKGLETYWQQVNFPLKLWNSILISGSVAVLAVGISLLNAYALGIGRVRGRLWIVGAFLLANMLPQSTRERASALASRARDAFKDSGAHPFALLGFDPIELWSRLQHHYRR